ncbi:MAG: MFS transporter [Peptococcaceae bacterium]|nr:MFS transporter [Peptococcaceae bacterium]
MRLFKTEYQARLWTKEFSLIIGINLLAYIVTYILMTTMPLFIQELGGNKVMAGLTSSLFTLGGFIARPWVGSLLDSKGRKKILLLGSFLLFIPITGYCVINSTHFLLALRVIQGLAFSAVSTATLTIAADLIPSVRRYEGIGYFGVSNAAAMAIGPALGLYYIEYFDYRSLYTISALLVIVIVGMGLGVRNRHPNKKQLPAKRKPVVFEKTALWPSTIYFLISLTAAVIVTFIPTYIISKKIENVGLFYVVYALLLLLTRPTTGRIADRMGPSKVILPGMLFITASFLLLFKAPSLPMFLWAAAFYGLGMGSVLPALNTLVIIFAPADRRGAANATFLAANDIGSALGAVMWGIVAQKMGLSYLYLFSPLFIVFAILVYLFALRKVMAR